MCSMKVIDRLPDRTVNTAKSVLSRSDGQVVDRLEHIVDSDGLGRPYASGRICWTTCSHVSNPGCPKWMCTPWNSLTPFLVRSSMM